MYLGIDPGKTGAIAVKIGNRMKVHNMPTTRQEMILWFQGLKTLSNKTNDPIFAVSELVHSMPGNTGKSMFTFGQWYERVLCCLSFNEIQFELVGPHKWQKAFGILTRKKEKKDDAGNIIQRGESKSEHKRKILIKAQSLFPSTKIGRLDNADAVLICEHGSREFQGG